MPDVDHSAHGGQWLDACGEALRQRLAQRLRQLPIAMETETAEGTVGIVHADFPYDDWMAIRDGRFGAGDEETCLWSLARYRTQYKQPVRSLRALVDGHVILQDVTRLGNVFYIDTGGWREGGRFTLLNLGTLEARS